MLENPFDILHALDPATTTSGVDLKKIAWLMSQKSLAAQGEALAALAAAEPLAKAPTPTAGNAKDELAAALFALQKNKLASAYTILDRALVEWPRRRALEMLLGKSALEADEGAFDAMLVPSGASPEVRALARRRLFSVATVLRLSAGKSDDVGGVLQTREALLGALALDKPTRSFVNPCRPLRVAVTPHPQKETTWRGVPVRYVDVPPRDASSRPPLVLIHGHSSCAEEYDPLIAALAPLLPDVRILVPDVPGSGYSWATHPSALSTDVYREFLREWLGEIGVTRYVPAGGSMGGNLTLQLLAAAPPTEVVAGIAWSPVAWREASMAMRLLADGARAAKLLNLFWPVYERDKEHWYPNWNAKDAMLELQRSDTYREEVDSDAYEDAYFDLAADQCDVMQIAKAPLVGAPVRLMAGVRDTDVMGVHESTVALHQRLAASGKTSDFFDTFVIGDHSLATEEPGRVADRLADWYRTHVG